MFVVGFAFRMTFLSNVRKMGWKRSVLRVICPRAVGLIMVDLMFEGRLFKDAGPTTWDAFFHAPWGAAGTGNAIMIGLLFGFLTQFGLAMVWFLPVIGRSLKLQGAYTFVSAALWFPTIYGIHQRTGVMTNGGGRKHIVVSILFMLSCCSMLEHVFGNRHLLRRDGLRHCSHEEQGHGRA